MAPGLFLEIAENLVKNGLQPLFLVGPTKLERWEKERNFEIFKKYHTLPISPQPTCTDLKHLYGFLEMTAGMAHLAGSWD